MEPVRERIAKLGEIRAPADGDLLELLAGPIRLAFGADFLYEGYRPVSSATGITSAQQALGTDASRNTKSICGELFVPVVGAANRDRILTTLPIEF